MYYDDSAIERSTVRALLRHLLPLLCLLSMANVLDRLNLGYAAPAMDPALRLSAAQLHFADTLFVAGYLAASLPAAFLLVRFGARRWIARIVVAWGVIAIAHAVVWNAASLEALRLLLGIAEAGLVPAMIFYLAGCIPSGHRAKAIAALVAAAAIAAMLGAPASRFLLFLGQIFGITDWRWLFVVEGLPALALGIHVPLELPETPADATWLPPAERHWLAAQLQRDLTSRRITSFAGGLQNTPVWKLAAIRAAAGVAAGATALWLPLAAQRTGYLGPDVTAAVAAFATLLGAAAAVAAAIWSDAGRRWRRVLAGAFLVAATCLAAAAVVPGAIPTALAMLLAAATVPTLLVLSWSLAPCFLAGAAAASGFALLNMAAVLGAFAGGWFPVLPDDVAMGCAATAVACLTAAALAWRLTEHPAAADQAIIA